MVTIDGKRVIIFAKTEFKENASLNFYCVEDQRDFLQIFGTSFLLNLSEIEGDPTKYKGLFYTNYNLS